MASVFTKIVKGEIPSYKIAENEHFYAFLDHEPNAKGHTLVVPKREENKLFLRQVSALMEIDQAIISKFERGERKPTKEQVLKFAEIYNLNPDDLVISWYSDKVAYDLQSEKDADKILKVAESKVKYLKSK